jgi:hypothetical protein
MERAQLITVESIVFVFGAELLPSSNAVGQHKFPDAQHAHHFSTIRREGYLPIADPLRSRPSGVQPMRVLKVQLNRSIGENTWARELE